MKLQTVKMAIGIINLNFSVTFYSFILNHVNGSKEIRTVGKHSFVGNRV